MENKNKKLDMDGQGAGEAGNIDDERKEEGWNVEGREEEKDNEEEMKRKEVIKWSLKKMMRTKMMKMMLMLASMELD